MKIAVNRSRLSEYGISIKKGTEPFLPRTDDSPLVVCNVTSVLDKSRLFSLQKLLIQLLTDIKGRWEFTKIEKAFLENILIPWNDFMYKLARRPPF